MTILEQFLANVRFADLLDVFVVAVLFYAGLQWLRRRTSRAGALVAALVALLYIAARGLGMYLTLFLFQTGLTIIVLSLVIVFQQDIRHSFEQLSAWRWSSRQRSRGWSTIVDVLLEALAVMAERRIGALVVLKGDLPLDHHVRGGIPLRGQLSLPLLLSIFHTDTPGHDGAVLIERDRIDKFAVHLPLSQHLDKVGAGGTRHTAALGLAECTDAIILVVSEERGTISIAANGKLEPAESLPELKARLAGFYQRHYAEASGQRRRLALAQNLGTKLLALGLAVFLWLSIAYRVDTVQRTFEHVPIEFRNLPQGWVLEEVDPGHVRLILSGSERAFTALNEKKLKGTIDLGKARAGQHEFPLTGDQVNLPVGVKVQRIEPGIVKFAIYPVTVVDLPVKATLEGQLPGDLVLQKVTVTPSRVKVEVPRAEAAKLTHIATERIVLDDVQQTGPVRTNLVLPPHATLPAGQTPRVQVLIRVKKAE